MQYWQQGHQLNDEKYIVEQLLGSGGFGVTYKVKQSRSNKPFAIKTLNYQCQQQSDFEQLQQKFINESIALASCRHPNIVRVYPQMFQERGLWCMVMEYIEGQDLASYLDSKGILTEPEAVSLIARVGNALTYVHQQGFLHRDIKPDNILLRSSDLSPVLIDFGLAREYTPKNSRSMTNARTEGYAPIEQYENRGNFGAWTDVYALAATLYVLVTKEMPIPARFRAYAELPSPKQFNPNLSDKLNTAILKGMALEPENRPQSVKEWLDLLLLKPVEVTATQPKVASPKPQSKKKQSKSFTQNKVEISTIQVTYQKLKSQKKIANPFAKKEKEAINTQPQVTSLNSKKVKRKNNLIKNKPFLISAALLLGIGITQLYGYFWYLEFPASPQFLISTFLSRRFIENIWVDDSITYGSLIYSPNGKYLANIGVYDNNKYMIQIRDVVTGEAIRNLKGHSNSIKTLTYSPDGKYIASGSYDNTIKIWNVLTGEIVHTLEDRTDYLAYSLEGKQIVSINYKEGGNNEVTIRVYDTVTGKVVRIFKIGNTDKIYSDSLAYSSDKKYLAIVQNRYQYDEHIKIWNIETEKAVLNLESHSASISSVAYSPDGKYIATAYDNSNIIIWNAVTGEIIRTLKISDSSNYFRGEGSLVYSPDGKYLVIWNYYDIILVDTLTGKLIRHLIHRKINSLAFSPDGKYIAINHFADKIKIWQIKN